VKAADPYVWVVGCGYAARGVSLAAPDYNALFVVRLSDGVSWMLQGDLGSPRRDWHHPFGITCDDIFTKLAIDWATRIVRIRLDSLGPGVQPD
jgi:hypothetical protein